MAGNEDNSKVSLVPTAEDPGYVYGTIAIQEGPNIYLPYGPLGVPPHDYAAEEAAYIAAAEKEANTNNGSWLGNTWNSATGKLALLGALAAAAILIGVLASHTSKKSAATSQSMTPAQASAAQAQMNQQLTTASQAFVSAGYSPLTVIRAQNQVALDYGTQIALATVVPPNAKVSTPLDAIGTNSPTHFASLATINTQAYVGSLSPSPTMIDIIKNSAAVHGLSTAAAQ